MAIRFNFSGDKQITALKADTNDDYLWMAFALNSDGYCIIEKNAKFQPTQTYYSLNKSVDAVVAMDCDATYLYAAYTDSSLLGEIISKTNPLTSTTEITNPQSESPVDVLINGTDLWFLLPGSASGTNAKLLRYNTSGVLQETVDLQESGNIVNNASTMTVDANDDIWIATKETPSKIVRVYEISGGTHTFTIDETLQA